MTTYYADANDVNDRLRLESAELADKAVLINAKIKTAYGIIQEEFSKMGSSAPDPTGTFDDILTDIQADLTAALYREDLMEFTDLSGERPVDKSWIWKKRAMGLLVDYVTRTARPPTDDMLYVVKVN